MSKRSDRNTISTETARRRVRRAGVASLLALLVGVTTVGTAGSAVAARWVHDDAAGDVAALTFGSDGSTMFSTVSQDQLRGDIERVAVRHRATKVKVGIRTRAAISGPLSSTVVIRTRDHAFLLSWLRTTGVNETDLLDIGRHAAGGVVHCPGLTRSASSDRKAVRFVIPRSCLRNPSWVRVGVELAMADVAADRSLVDDGLDDAPLRDFGRPALSPKVGR
ncbi:hypothetical protein [Nocardioides daeguensis]|uniref:Uncharacterized protein n=1 Tax=Nocardioides daeguensis TaxID=908359 RepID=A0ABP6WAM6_9ACTN|nr:hypothetical protein [Nocardioides daeguensis]MBV6729315.1 hypothetical protein [Nocardioides daeguensis]MCR1774291.1 hypothetical protein [Nocardioides daeguensis]